MSRAAGEAWALIPARGGSKSIPRKNLLELCGRPLIAYSILHAQKSQTISRIIVSTDDPEIAAVAKSLGAEVPFMRPAEYSRDDSTDLEVFRHASLFFSEQEGRLPDLWVHLRPTGPVRSSDAIDRAVSQMSDTPWADALRSVSAVLDTPYKMWTLKDAEMVPLLSIPGVAEAHSMPRQRLPQVFLQNGYVDVIRPRTILELGSMVGRRVIPLVTTCPIVDLDVPEQIPAAEEAIRTYLRTQESPP